GGAGLGGGRALGAVGENFAAEFDALIEGVLEQKAAVGKVAVAGLGDEGFAAAAVEQPFADVLLRPERNPVPDFADAQPAGIAASRHFEHGEAADLGKILAFFDEGDFGAELGVSQAE